MSPGRPVVANRYLRNSAALKRLHFDRADSKKFAEKFTKSFLNVVKGSLTRAGISKSMLGNKGYASLMGEFERAAIAHLKYVSGVTAEKDYMGFMKTNADKVGGVLGSSKISKAKSNLFLEFCAHNLDKKFSGTGRL